MNRLRFDLKLPELGSEESTSYLEYCGIDGYLSTNV
jgi:hypothetical protein